MKNNLLQIKYFCVRNFGYLFLALVLLGLAIFYSCNTDKNPFIPTGTSQDWGVGYAKDSGEPNAPISEIDLAKMNGFYRGNAEDKKLYLTFDCGYENGNTEKILDALKKHHIKATFFVVGHYLDSASDIVKRMLEEGHTVGNHTYHHKDMSQISDPSVFKNELEMVETKFKEITGQDMIKYYRPPQGKFQKENLEQAKNLGYKTFFWSLAYVDWDTKKQPSREEAFEKILSRTHNGAIVLLHNTSNTNGEILDELLTKWEQLGYSFGQLSEFQDMMFEGRINLDYNHIS